MKRAFYLSFLVLLGLDTFGQVAFKLAGERTLPVSLDWPWLTRVAHEPWAWAIAGCYISAFLTYMMLIKRAAVGAVFAASHLEVGTVLIVSYLYFGERLTLIQALGALAILTGVVILGFTEREEA